MIRVRVALLTAAITAAATVAACGSGGGGAGHVSNDSCNDTAGSSSYYDDPGTNGPPVGQQIAQMPHAHVAPPTRVTYEHNPPTSGCHYNLGYGKAPVSAGVYSTHIDAEYWVHNLEHGYIVVLYNCGDGTAPTACQTDFQALRAWYERQGADPGLSAVVGQQQAYAKIVVIPWKMDRKFAVVSWNWYDGFDKLDTSPTGELQKFVDNHVNHSPEGLGTQ